MSILNLLDQSDISQSVIICHSWATGFSGKAARTKDLFLFGAIIHRFWIVDRNEIVGFNDEKALRSNTGLDEIIDIAAEFRMTRLQALKCVDTFVKNDLLKTSKLDDAEIIDLLKSKSPQRINKAVKLCFWCQGSTYSLQDHHYPIPRSKGGKNVIQICPNCHYEFHSLSQRKFYKLTDKAISVVLGGLKSCQ